MNVVQKIVWLGVLLSVCFRAGAQEDSTRQPPRFTVKGYLKYLDQASFAQDPTQLQTNELIHNRLNFRYTPASSLVLRLEVRNRLYFGELVQDYPGFASLVTTTDEPINLSKNWVNKNSVLLNSTIDRACAEFTAGKWDITMGRQRINWGINTVWTPNDIFNSFNYFDFDYEERPGNDAARVQYTLGSSSSAEVDFSPGKTIRQDISALMYKFNKWNYDVQVFSGICYTDYVAGAGWAGNIKGAGFKGEVSWFSPYDSYTDTASFTASVSFDYGFKKGIYVLVSGLYNSQGRDTGFNVVQLTSGALSAKNLLPFKFAAFAQVSYSFTPIFKAAFSTMYAPDGNSLVLLPTASYSVANNWVLDLVGQSFFSTLNREYTSVGNSFYLRLKWGF